MYTFLRGLKSRRVALTELPALSGSVVIAELFYKFHSFSLECLAFLATWLVLGGIASLAGSLVAPDKEASIS